MTDRQYSTDITDAERERCAVMGMGVEGMVAELSALCIDPVFSGDSQNLMWSFQPYGRDETGVIGFMRVWYTSEPLKMNAVVYDDRPLNLRRHLVDAIITVRRERDELRSYRAA